MMDLSLQFSSMMAVFMCLAVGAAEERINFTDVTNATISAYPVSSSNSVGTGAAFNCTIHGYRPPSSSIRWHKGSDPSQSLPANSTKILNNQTTQLIFDKVTMLDAGYYTCSLVLQDGRRETVYLEDHVNLSVGNLPSPVHNFTCYSRVPYQGYCKWDNTDDSDGSNTHHTLQMKKRREKEWSDVQCNNADYNSYAQHVECQLRNNDYYNRFNYRVQSENGFGIVETKSTPYSFSIDNDVVPYPPHDISLTAHSSDSMYISWQPPDAFIQSGWRILYKLRYKIGRIGEWKEVDLSEKDRHAVDITIIDLKPPYEYICVQLSAAESTNGKWSEWSEMKWAHLLEEKPAVKPVDLSYDVTDKKDKSVQISWKPLPKEKQNGKILGYNITVIGLQDGNTEYRHTYTLSQNVTDYEITGLNKTYTYDIEVVAYNSQGASPKAVINIDASDMHHDELSIIPIVLPSGCLLLIIIILMLYCGWRKFNAKKFVVRLPDIVTENNSRGKFFPPSFRVQETECYDELNTTQFYNNMEDDNHHLPKRQEDMRMYRNFMSDKDDLPAIQPLINRFGFETEDRNGLLELATVAQFLPGGSISQQYSPRSVGSGGSYLSCNEDNDIIVYNVMTSEGLSPIDKCSPVNQWEESKESKNNRARSVSQVRSSNQGSTIDLYVTQSQVPKSTIVDVDGRSISQDFKANPLPYEKKSRSLTDIQDCMTILKSPISINDDYSKASSEKCCDSDMDVHQAHSEGSMDGYVHQLQSEGDMDDYLRQAQPGDDMEMYVRQAQLTSFLQAELAQNCSACFEQDKVAGDQLGSQNKTDGHDIGTTSTESPVADYVLSGTQPHIEQSNLDRPVEDYVQCSSLRGNIVIDNVNCLPSPVYERPESPVINDVQSPSNRIGEPTGYVSNVSHTKYSGPQSTKGTVCCNGEMEENDCFNNVGLHIPDNAPFSIGETEYIPFRSIAVQLPTSQEVESIGNPQSVTSEDQSETSTSESGCSCLSQVNSSDDELEKANVTIVITPNPSYEHVSYGHQGSDHPIIESIDSEFNVIVTKDFDAKTDSDSDASQSPRYISHDKMSRQMELTSPTHQPIASPMNNNDATCSKNKSVASGNNLRPSGTMMSIDRQLQRDSDDGYSSSHGNHSPPYTPNTLDDDSMDVSLERIFEDDRVQSQIWRDNSISLYQDDNIVSLV